MDPTKRFSNRVDQYIRYRPYYPLEIVQLLKDQYALTQKSVIADIGAGVGHSARLFSSHVGQIYGIEPNREMYKALRNQMKGSINFKSVPRAAEKTGLDDNSIDFIICGQSYHWFDKPKAKSEFSRILKENGYVILMWNTRQINYPFGKEYEDFLTRYSIDYEVVHHKNLTDIDYDFLLSSWKRHSFHNEQVFDYPGLVGRFSSSSYAPSPNSIEFEVAKKALKSIFEAHSKENQVSIEYKTDLIIGRI